ncbi:MAG: cupredoxin domain-containing protein [Chloroflexota bacterium]|nr:cupredoxin domain-containing protein [Chloroflexota bacterium]
MPAESGRHARGARGATGGPGLIGGGDAAGFPTTLTVEAVDIDFNPDAFTVPARTDVQVTMTNRRAIPHTFTIDELGVDEILQPGKAREITIDALADDYTCYCQVPGHRQAEQVGTPTAT